MATSEEETKYCSNCKRDIAVVNYVMHEVHCRRNIILCKHCKEPVPKSEQEEHFEEYHVKVKCDLCQRSLEISQLEDHKKDDCPKRTSPPCEFCELTFPVCEIVEHKDYCGSRTEQCPLCGQFIQLKNQTRHEDTNCEFPPRKTESIRTGPAQRSRLPGGATSSYNNLDSDDDLQSSFAMHELSRMLQDQSITGASRVRANERAKVPKNPLAPKRNNVIRSRPNQNPPNMTRNAISTSRAASNGRVDLAKTSSSSASNKSKNTNVQRQAQANSNRAPKNKPQNVGMDRLLAMHLTQDLQRGDGASLVDDRDLNEFVAEGPGQDEPALPCEFCDELYPMAVLIQHQTGCNPELAQLRNVNISPVPGTSRDNDYDGSLNNRQMASKKQVPSGPRSPPYMLHNFNNDTDGFHDYDEEPFNEDIMLPCEFCDNLFPMESLVHHQVVCDANFTQTPRSMTPAANSRSKVSHKPESSYLPKNNRAGIPKRQSDPNLDFLNGGSERSSNGDPFAELSSSHAFRNINAALSSSTFMRFDIPEMPHATKSTNIKSTRSGDRKTTSVKNPQANGAARQSWNSDFTPSASKIDNPSTSRKASNPSSRPQRYPGSLSRTNSDTVQGRAVTGTAPPQPAAGSTRNASSSRRAPGGVTGGSRTKKPPGAENARK